MNKKCWVAMWRSKGSVSGEDRHLICDTDNQNYGVPVLFRTKTAAAEWIREHYSYIATRQDLRSEPHGWRMPIPVRVDIGLSLT